MALFHLQIVTPDRLVYDAQAEKLIVRTVTGDVCILARHIDYAVPLGIGKAAVTDEKGEIRYAACNGGFLSVSKGEARLMPITFEWADEIDLERAQAAKEKAEKAMAESRQNEIAYIVAEAKLKRALLRIETKNQA